MFADYFQEFTGSYNYRLTYPVTSVGFRAVKRDGQTPFGGSQSNERNINHKRH
jgi:hypothetical protein